MFKKLIPVIALALIAGPVFAADAPATSGASQSTTAPAKGSHHSKKSHHSSKSSKSKSTTDSSATAPAK
jgi:hypothetical protein